MTYKTKGIILKRRNFGEADRLLTIYTEKEGKIVAIARGVRRSRAKMVGHTELFYLLNLQLVEGKTWDIVTSAEIIDEFSHLRAKERLTNQAYLTAELVDNLTHQGELHEDIFNLLQSSFTRLDQGYNQLILSFFCCRILSFLGHRPELQHCVKCRNKLSPYNHFSNQLGGILCENCSKSYLGSFAISVSSIKIMRLFLEKEMAVLDQLRVDSKVEKELEQILINYAQYIIEKPLKSARFV